MERQYRVRPGHLVQKQLIKDHLGGLVLNEVDTSHISAKRHQKDGQGSAVGVYPSWLRQGEPTGSTAPPGPAP